MNTQRPSGISVGKPGEQGKKQIEWEHRHELVGAEYDISTVRDGWELVAVIPIPGMQRSLYFKRRKQ